MKRLVKALVAKLLGERGEDAAVRFLKSLRYAILTVNYRTSRGEVDIIAIDGKTIVFVEVKTRRQGHPAEAVTVAKQKRIKNAALQFLRSNNLLDNRCRFDVISIVWPDDHTSPVIQHIINAFEPNDRWQFHS